MHLVTNWHAIARRAHSMWAFYLGLALLWIPDLLFWATGIDTNPRLWFVLANVAFVYGIVGRLIAQGGIDRTTARSPAPVVLLVLAVAVAGIVMTAERPAVPDASVIAAPPAPVATPEAAFLGHAVPLVAKWEGLRTEAYLDPVGIPTVCYGETKGVRMGDRYTPEECRAMLERELLAYRAGLHRHLTAETKASRLPATRDAAYTSLAYNVGVAGAGRSTAVRRLNGGDIPGGCEALTWWNRAGDRVLRGLVNRRAEEKELCLRGLEIAAFSPPGLWPPRSDTITQRAEINTETPRDLWRRQVLTEKADADIRSDVTGLLDRSGPTAISRFVTPVPVEAINGGPLGALAHVREELGEVTPLIRNSYAGASVGVEFRMFRIDATLDHLGPRYIGPRLAAVTGVPMAPSGRRCAAASRAVSASTGSEAILGNVKLRGAFGALDCVPDGLLDHVSSPHASRENSTSCTFYKAGGRVLRGLVSRRAEERDLCMIGLRT